MDFPSDSFEDSFLTSCSKFAPRMAVHKNSHGHESRIALFGIDTTANLLNFMRPILGQLRYGQELCYLQLSYSDL